MALACVIITAIFKWLFVGLDISPYTMPHQLTGAGYSSIVHSMYTRPSCPNDNTVRKGAFLVSCISLLPSIVEYWWMKEHFGSTSNYITSHMVWYPYNHLKAEHHVQVQLQLLTQVLFTVHMYTLASKKGSESVLVYFDYDTIIIFVELFPQWHDVSFLNKLIQIYTVHTLFASQVLE